MLSNLVKEHSEQQVIRREEQEIKRQEAVKAAADLTQALVDHLNVGVAQVETRQFGATLYRRLPKCLPKIITIPY
jgi:hypothetical protein